MELMDEVRVILSKGYLMSLATIDESGPWVSDVVFVFKENCNIYWLSKPDARHSIAIKNNSKVAASITVNTSKEPDLGLQISGIAEKIEGDLIDLAKAHRIKRGKSADLRMGELLDNGRCWYVLRPQLIDIIDEVKYGFEKPSLKINDST